MQQYCPETKSSCSTVISQTVDIGLPISLVPSLNLGGIEVMCCGVPRVECCNAIDCCKGLSIKITQTISYKIPIEYCAQAIPGDVTLDCKNNLQGTNCTPCHY